MPESDLREYAAQWDHPLDMGVVLAVKLLRDHNIATTECCEGGEGHSAHRPTVWFKGSPGEAWRAVGILLDRKLPLRAMGSRWVFDWGNLPSGPEWYVEFWEKLPV